MASKSKPLLPKAKAGGIGKAVAAVQGLQAGVEGAKAKIHGATIRSHRRSRKRK